MDKLTVMYRNPIYNMAFTIMEPMPVALLVALISAGLLSRGRKREESDRHIAGMQDSNALPRFS